MKKCKEKVMMSPTTTIQNRRHIVKPTPSSTNSSVITSGHCHRGRLSTPPWPMLLLLSLSVIIATHLVAAASAQLAEPIQQQQQPFSPYTDPSQGRHGGNLYAPQHGYDNNIEFIHDQTESIYEVPSQLDQDEVEIPVKDELPEIGAGDTYLHNGAPEQLDHHHLNHLDDESLNENLLPGEGGDGDEGAGNGHGEFTELDGGIIVGEKVLRQSESPYVLNTDLEVERGGVLTVEPGVTMEFAPMVGITVRGVINAVVSGGRMEGLMDVLL